MALGRFKWCAAAMALAVAGCAGPGSVQPLAGDASKPRPGLWRVENGAAGGPRMAASACVGATGSALGRGEALSGAGARGVSCETSSFTAPGLLAGSRTSCVVGEPGSAESKLSAVTEFRGDFSTSYEATTRGVATLADGSRAEFAFSTSARWMGPCPEGMADGDVEFDTGARAKAGPGGR